GARRDLDGDQVALPRVGGGAGRNRELAPELLLVDRRQPSAAAGQRAKDAEHALPGAIDDLDDAALMADLRVVVVFGARLGDADQRAVVDARDLARPRAARRRDANLRRRPARLPVPFRRP